MGVSLGTTPENRAWVHSHTVAGIVDEMGKTLETMTCPSFSITDQYGTHHTSSLGACRWINTIYCHPFFFLPCRVLLLHKYFIISPFTLLHESVSNVKFVCVYSLHHRHMKRWIPKRLTQSGWYRNGGSEIWSFKFKKPSFWVLKHTYAAAHMLMHTHATAHTCWRTHMLTHTWWLRYMLTPQCSDITNMLPHDGWKHMALWLTYAALVFQCTPS